MKRTNGVETQPLEHQALIKLAHDIMDDKVFYLYSDGAADLHFTPLAQMRRREFAQLLAWAGLLYEYKDVALNKSPFHFLSVRILDRSQAHELVALIVQFERDRRGA